MKYFDWIIMPFLKNTLIITHMNNHLTITINLLFNDYNLQSSLKSILSVWKQCNLLIYAGSGPTNS